MKVFTCVLLVFAFIGLVPLCSSAQQYSAWTPPVNLGPVINTDVADYQSCISKDGLTLYFTSVRPRGDPPRMDWDIYVSKRASIGAPWGPPENIGTPVNTEYDEGSPSLSIDGHRLYFQSNRPDGFGLADIWVSRRQDKRNDFGWNEPTNLGGYVNTPSNDATPWIFNDEARGITVLYFASDRAGGLGGASGGQGNDMYTSVMGPDETFSPPLLLTDINTAKAERAPSVRRDGLELFFLSDRPGGSGLLDIWVATRATVYDAWSSPVNLGPTVNSPSRDARPAISFDGTELYFQSDRPGSTGENGTYDLWVTTRTKLKR